MARLFLSYARADEAVATLVDAALVRLGHDVWRDDQLPGHRAYSDVIEERLRDAEAVVVLWSAASAASQWVRAEADVGRNANKLVQAGLDGTMPPMPFNQIQCIPLADWGGSDQHGGWNKVVASIAEVTDDNHQPTRAPQAPRTQSICVLPFRNLSGDAEQDYFSDGISEDITTDLSKLSSLCVVARNTAFSFKNAAIGAREVARQLGVSHMLEGSVRKAGDRVRITAQLVDGASGNHLWAERYDRDLTDIFAIQDEISSAIVGALKLTLLPTEEKALQSRGTDNVEAYNLYLMARQFWISGNYGDVRRDQLVSRTAQRAIDLDHKYGKAWALKALAQASLRYHHGIEGDDGLDAAERALEIDDTIAEAYAVRARYHAEQGNFDVADREIDVGLRLNPDSWEVNREAARLSMMQRRIDRATKYFEHAAELDPSDFHSTMMLSTCYRDVGDDVAVKRNARQMIERAEAVLVKDPLNASALGCSAGGHGMLGDVDRAMERYHRAMMIDPDNINMPYNFACVLANFIVDKSAALDLLEFNFTKATSALLLTALADPDMDPLRDQPRFKVMVRLAMDRLGISRDTLSEEVRAQLDLA